MTYSLDFRKKVLEIKEEKKLSYEETAKYFQIGKTTLVRWNKQLEPKKTRNKGATKIDMEKLRLDMELYPDAYQYERAKRFGVSQRGIALALKRLGISCKKKSLIHLPANLQKQKNFLDKIEVYKKAGKDIIYIDESGFANDMPKVMVTHQLGKRCFGKLDWHSKGRTNVIGALLFGVLLTASLFNCNINADIFYAWMTQDLLPKIKRQSVIVLDNASFHKRTDIQQAILNEKHIIEFLPPYSPQLNPIEYKWAQAKALRKQKHCSINDIFTKYNI